MRYTHHILQATRPLVLLCTLLVAFATPTQVFAETRNYLNTIQLPVDTELVANSVAVDTEGSRIVVGDYSGSATFASGEPTETTINSNGDSDIFIAKFDSAGDFLWVVSVGGTGEDHANAVVTSPNDNAPYIVGTFSDEVYFNDEEVGLPSKDAPSLQTSLGFGDSYALKFSSSGVYAWVYVWGNEDPDESARAVALDSFERVYVVGTMNGDVNFDHDPMTVHGSMNYGSYIHKLDSTGTHIWAITRNGPTLQFNSVATDSSDNVIVVGQFTNMVTFDTAGIAGETFSSAGSTDAFVFKVTSNGFYLSAEYWGGSEADAATDIAIGPNDEMYISGYFSTTTDFDPGAGTESTTTQGNNDAYILSLDNTLGYNWHRTWGGTGTDQLNALILPDGANAQLYGTGRFENSVSFDPGNVDTDTAAGAEDGYAISLTTLGAYDWHTVWGGTGSDIATDTAYGPANTLSLVGYFQDQVDFDFSTNSDERTAYGTSDGFLTTYTFAAETTANSSGTTTTTQSSQGLSAPTTPGCADTPPAGIPDLFQITRNGPDATLYFTPVKNNTSSYYISYGQGDASEGYGTSFPYSDSSGVISYTIHALDPTKPYTFKVRAGNGCATGLWSHWITVGPARTQLANTSSSAGPSVLFGVGLLAAGYTVRKLTDSDAHA